MLLTLSHSDKIPRQKHGGEVPPQTTYPLDLLSRKEIGQVRNLMLVVVALFVAGSAHAQEQYIELLRSDLNPETT